MTTPFQPLPPDPGLTAMLHGTEAVVTPKQAKAFQKAELRPLTLIMAFYENPGMLVEQQKAWRALPEDLKANFHAIVTDDGSPTRPALPVAEPTGIASFQLNRTLVDVRWNWLFARNLGVSQSPTRWVLLTDIDHLLPESTLRKLMTEELDDQIIYRFSRLDAPHPMPASARPCACGARKCPGLTPYKPHPNSWLLTTRMFDRMGGYDERFSGFYGTDADFRDRANIIPNNAATKPAKGIVMRADPLIRYPREVIADASTTTYGRKERQDHINVQRIRAERDVIKDWKPLRVTFPYEQLIYWKADDQ